MQNFIEVFMKNYLQWWDGLSDRCKNLWFLLFYIIAFSVCGIIIFSSFISQGKTFIWRQDGFPQHYTYLHYFGLTIKRALVAFLETGVFELPIYDFNIGMGGTYFTLGSVEFFNFISVFIKVKNYESLYSILVLLRFFLVGLSFSVYCFYMKKKHLPVLMGSIVYTFSGFALAGGTKHPLFLNALILLPLLLVGLEKVIRKENPIIFILLVFCSLCSSYYFLYMNTIAMGIYTVVRIFDIYKENRMNNFVQALLRVVLYYLIGSLMACVIFLPVIYNYFNSLRTNAVYGLDNLFSYGGNWLKALPMYFIAAGYGNGKWLILQFPPIVILMLITLFTRKDKEYLSYKVGFLLLFMFCSIPIFALVLTGFGNVNNRWCYMLAFLVSLIAVKTFTELKNIGGLGKGISIIFLLIYIAINILDAYFNKNIYVYLASILLLLSVLIVFAYGNRASKYSRYNLKLFELLIVVFTCFTVALYGNMTFSPSYMNLSKEFANNGEVQKVFRNSQDGVFGKIEDEDFYRVDKVNNTQHYINDSLLLKYNGISMFSSTLDKNIMQYMKELEVTGLKNILVLGTLDTRSILDELAAVKYFVCSEGEEGLVPFGYEFIKKISNSSNPQKDYLLYENKVPLSLGYTYSNYLLEEQYNTLNLIEKQETMLHNVVLNEKLNGFNHQEDNTNLLSKQIPYEITEYSDVEYKDGKLSVKKDRGSLTINFGGFENSETYIRLKGIDTNKSVDVSANNEFGEKRVKILADNYLYAHGFSSYTMNLGYSESPQTFAKITFQKKGTYSLEDIEVYCQPMNNYIRQVEALRAEPFENVVIGNDTITGTVDLSENKILCFSIPYSAGWTAKVDGQPAELLRANTMYMALPLEAGVHEIELNYSVPGVWIGAVLSALGFGAFIVVIFLRRKLNHKLEDC